MKWVLRSVQKLISCKQFYSAHARELLFLWILFLGQFLSACTTHSTIEQEDLSSASAIVEQMEADLSGLEVQMLYLKNHFDFLISHRDSILEIADKTKYKFRDGYSTNGPQDDLSLSSVVIFIDNFDSKSVMNQVYLSNGMDSVFRKVYKDSGIISQVYFNTSKQLSRVYPAYDASLLLDRKIDVTNYNFYYEGDLAHNPSKGMKWIPTIYVDPAGRGYILSLVQPIYDGEELFAVLGIDVTVNEISSRYLSPAEEELLITTNDGTVVGGKAEAMEALSLPPLRNHVYLETVRKDKFRVEALNLFKSKNREVREMAESILCKGEDKFIFHNEFSPQKIAALKIEKFDWYLLQIKGQSR